MRLRLSIARHELPLVKILWHVEDEPLNISSLLEQIDNVIPLESDGWGTEDYVVQLAGYECLHYLDVHNILDEDDEVSIRALKTSDIRARTISGRHQISAAGAHLIDGIAFGRSYHKRPDRPPVHIPPRKRRRLMYDNNDRHEDSQSTLTNHPQLTILSKLDDADEISDEDMDFEPDYASSFATDGLPAAGKLRSGKRRKSVSFTENSSLAGLDGDLDNSGDTSKDAFEVDDHDSASDNKSNSGTVHAKIKSASMKSPSTHKKDISGDGSNRLGKRPHSSSSSSSSSSQLSSSGSSSSVSSGSSSSSSSGSSSADSSNEDSSESEEEDESATLSHESPEKSIEPKASTKKGSESRSKLHAPKGNSKSSNLVQEVHGTKGQSATDSLQVVLQKQSAPGQGMRTTKMRNQRRKDNKRLQYLEKAGLPAAILPKGTQKKQDEAAPQIKDNSPLEHHRRRLLDSIAASGIDINQGLVRVQSVAMNGDGAHKSDEGLVPTHLATSSKDKTLIEVTVNDTPDETDSTFHAKASVMPFLGGLASNVPDLPRPRSKIDLASSRRMVFGSLGLKNPKTKEDEDKLRTKLAASATNARAKKVVKRVVPDPYPITNTVEKHSYQSVQAVAQSGATTDVDAWKSKIRLTAVECCEKGVVLSTPPFPFVQRWDPQQQLHAGSSSARGKKRKRKSQQCEDSQEYQEEPRQYDQYEASNALAYDGAIEYPLNSQDGHYQVTSQLLREVVRGSRDDLPALPEHISELQSLTMNDIQPTAIIAFQQLEISQATNWQPSLSPHRTAIVDAFETESGLLYLTLAQRDVVNTQARYDDDGERIYGKFEMVDVDEDKHADTDDSKVEILFSDMTEPKLVRAASKSDAEVGSQETGPGAKDLSQTAIIQDSINPDEFVIVTAEHGSNSSSADESQIGEHVALYNSDSVELQAAQLPTSAHPAVSDQGSSNGVGAGIVFGTGAETQESQQSGLSVESRTCVEASA